MSDAVQATSCANHPGRSATSSCIRCGKPICESCRVEIVATEQTFCSERCRDALPTEPGRPAISNATLKAGLDRPILGGWGLWARSTGRIATLVLPPAVVAGLAAGYLGRAVDDSTPSETGTTAAVVLVGLILLCAIFGVAVVGIVLSDRHSGLVAGAPFAVASRRFVPWVLTWLLMTGITVAGYIALIVPGIYLGLRLFWADEFALVHGKGPIAALRASWELTRKKVSAVFGFQFVLGFAGYAVIFPAALLVVAVMAGLDAIGGSAAGLVTGIQVLVVFVVGLTAYGALHGPEIVQFYGMRAAKAESEAAVAPGPARGSSGPLFAVGALLAATVGMGVLGVLIVPNIFGAIDMGRQMRTYQDSYAIAVAMESFAEVEGAYPQAGSIAELEGKLAPDHIEVMPTVDGWGRAFRVVSEPGYYEIRSAGKDGSFETFDPSGATYDADRDMVWRSGELLQWPAQLGLE